MVAQPAALTTTRDESRRGEARALLERWFTARVVADHRGSGIVGMPQEGEFDQQELTGAAVVVLAGVQEDLRTLDSPVEWSLARLYMRERHWALSWFILNYHARHKLAKEVLLDLSGGAPLTICMGGRYKVGRRRKTVEYVDHFGSVQFTVEGCLSVMPDSKRTSGGEMWPGLCDDCRNPHKKTSRDQGEELQELVRNMGKNATVYVAGFDGHVETSCPTPWIVESARARRDSQRSR
jgi:hypothetical protein